jgi:hypothetical protein
MVLLKGLFKRQVVTQRVLKPHSHWRNHPRDELLFRLIYRIILTWAFLVLLTCLLGAASIIMNQQQENSQQPSQTIVIDYGVSLCTLMVAEEDNPSLVYPTLLPLASVESSSMKQKRRALVVSVAFNKEQFRELIEDVLHEAGLYSPAAVELLMLTCAVESNFGTYIKQVRGPALGVFQMEPNTHDDIWDNYLRYRKSISYFIRHDLVVDPAIEDDLRRNIAYAIIMTRVHYLRVSEPLPEADDVEGLANYWKRHYNTMLGRGTVEKAITKYEEYCA